MATIYRVSLKVGYNEKELYFQNYNAVSEFIRFTVMGSNDTEIRIRTHETEEGSDE